MFGYIKTMAGIFDLAAITVGTPVVSAKGAKTVPLSSNGNPIMAPRYANLNASAVPSSLFSKLIINITLF